MPKRVRPGNPKLAIAYLRASTTDQKLSPEAQRSTIETWAAREGVHVHSWHVDQGVSGTSPIDERPALIQALASLRDVRAGVLVVAKRDRIARDVAVAIMTERVAAKAGARLLSADGTGNGDSPADQFMRVVIDGAAQYEAAIIRVRTREALAAKRARGEKLGGRAPYGQRLAADGVHLERDADEQAVIALVRDLGARLPMRAIVYELSARGLTSRAGRPFQLTQVARMMA